MNKWLLIGALWSAMTLAGTTDDELAGSSGDAIPVASSSNASDGLAFKPLPQSEYEQSDATQKKIYGKREKLGDAPHIMVGHHAKKFGHEPCVLHGRSSVIVFESLNDERMVLLGGCFIEEGKEYKISITPIEADGDFEVKINSTGFLAVTIDKNKSSGVTVISIKPHMAGLAEYDALDGQRLLDRAAVRLYISATKLHPRTPTKGSQTSPGNVAAAMVEFSVQNDAGTSGTSSDR